MERNMAAEHKNKFALWQKTPYPDYDESVHSPHKGALMQYNWNCDIFVLGSDQLLRAGFVWDMGFHQCMDWVYSNKYKIAYATSFGSGTFEGDDRLRAREGFFLKRFQKISVREASGIDILKNDFGLEATHVLDPVFLCEVATYEKMAKFGSMRLPDGKFTAAYILDPTESRAEMVRHISKNFTNENAIAVSDVGRVNDDGYKWSFPTLEKVKVEEWLAVIKNCDFFLTDSFHGVCFALIFHKQFAVTFDKTQWRGLERIVSILEMFGLRDRLVSNLQDVKDRHFETNQIDYEKISRLIDAKRADSLTWLQDAIAERKAYKVNDTVYDVLLDTKNELYYNIDFRVNELSSRLTNEMQTMNERNNLLQNEINALRNSKSFRLGRLITYLPRKVRDFFRGR